MTPFAFHACHARALPAGGRVIAPAFPVAAALLLACAGAAQGACRPGAHPVFSCATEPGRVVEVCDDGQAYRYWYGRRNGPVALAFSVPHAQATLRTSRSTGRFTSVTLVLPRHDWTYAVFWGSDREAPGAVAEAGIDIGRGDGRFDSVACRPDTVVQQLDRLVPAP